AHEDFEPVLLFVGERLLVPCSVFVVVGIVADESSFVSRKSLCDHVAVYALSGECLFEQFFVFRERCDFLGLGIEVVIADAHVAATPGAFGLSFQGGGATIPIESGKVPHIPNDWTVPGELTFWSDGDGVFTAVAVFVLMTRITGEASVYTQTFFEEQL